MCTASTAGQACTAVASRQALNAYDVANEAAAAQRVTELRLALPAGSGVRLLSGESELLEYLAHLRAVLLEAQVCVHGAVLL